MHDITLPALLSGTREDALSEAEQAITARLAGYDPRRDRAAIAATHMAALAVKRLRTGETATEIEPSFVVVSREPTEAMIEAAAASHIMISRGMAYDAIRAALATGAGHEA